MCLCGAIVPRAVITKERALSTAIEALPAKAFSVWRELEKSCLRPAALQAIPAVHALLWTGAGRLAEKRRQRTGWQ